MSRLSTHFPYSLKGPDESDLARSITSSTLRSWRVLNSLSGPSLRRLCRPKIQHRFPLLVVIVHPLSLQEVGICRNKIFLLAALKRAGASAFTDERNRVTNLVLHAPFI